MTTHPFAEIAVALAAGEIPEDDVAGGYSILEVEPPNGPGEVFMIENPDYPYVYIYQVLHRLPGVSRCIWRKRWTHTGEVVSVKYMPPRFLCKLVDMRRTDG